MFVKYLLTLHRQKLRLQNQIAALDEDDVEYHQSILESERAKEAAIRKETSEQLALFRKHQEEAEREALAKSGSPVEEQDTWVVGGKKRKKIPEKGSLLGIKLRKSSTSSDHSTSDFNDKNRTVAAGTTGSTVEVEKVQNSEISRLKFTPQGNTEPPSTTSPRSSPKSSLAELPSTAVGSKANTNSINTTSPSRSTTRPSLVLGLDDYSSEED